MRIEIKKLYDDVEIPRHMTSGSAGFDIMAYLTPKNGFNIGEISIEPNKRYLVPAGFSVAIPEGYELQIRPRSGLVYKEGLTVPNTPGTVDSDYRGPVGVLIHNISDSIKVIYNRERIAQGIISKVEQAEFEVVEELSKTERGSGGFGHTGR